MEGARRVAGGSRALAWSDDGDTSVGGANGLARLLWPFGIRPARGREDAYTPGTQGYALASFKDLFARYLPTSSSRSDTPFTEKTTTEYVESPFKPTVELIRPEKIGPAPSIDLPVSLLSLERI
jgi:hypothetical protein